MKVGVYDNTKLMFFPETDEDRIALQWFAQYDEKKFIIRSFPHDFDYPRRFHITMHMRSKPKLKERLISWLKHLKNRYYVKYLNMRIKFHVDVYDKRDRDNY